MKHIFSKTKALLIVLCIGWGMLATSCINEDLDACRTNAYTLTLHVLNLDGEDITVGSANDVADASVFIFDENGKWLETVKMTSAEITALTPIEVNYPSTAKLQIVAWGNVDNDRQELKTGETIDDLKVMVSKSGGYAQSPDSLFYGMEVVPLTQGELQKNEELPIQLAIGRLQMRTLNLQAGIQRAIEEGGLRADEVDCQFYFQRTLDQMNASGTVEGSDISYDPNADWVNGEWEMTEFANVFPGELQLGKIDVAGNNVGFSKEEEKDYETGELLRADPRQETIIVFVWGDTGEYLGARIKVRPWGAIDDPIEW